MEEIRSWDDDIDVITVVKKGNGAWELGTICDIKINSPCYLLTKKGVIKTSSVISWRRYSDTLCVRTKNHTYSLEYVMG